MDVVALIALVTLPLTGILTVSEALAGFSDSSVVLIGALFVVGEGLVRTGIANRIGDFLLHRSGGSETRLLMLLMLAVSLLGSLMSSTGVVAIFIPVVLLVAERQKLSPGRLMMPLSFAGLISGMLTLVGTASNLVAYAGWNARASRVSAFSVSRHSVRPSSGRASATCSWPAAGCLAAAMRSARPRRGAT